MWEWGVKTAKWRSDRLSTMKDFCEREGGSFAPFAAWCEAMVEMQVRVEGEMMSTV